VLGVIGAAGAAAPAKKAEAPKTAPAPKAAAAPAPAPKAAPAPVAKAVPAAKPATASDYPLAPAVRHLVEDHGLDPKKIPASGKDGRLTKADVLSYIAGGGEAAPRGVPERGPMEERVKMTRLRKKIAERLKDAQNTAAMLTTFNEADMSAVMGLRNKFK